MKHNAEVIEIAKSHIGLPYVWAGDFTIPDDVVTPLNVKGWAQAFPDHYSKEKKNILLTSYQGKPGGDCSGLISHTLGLKKTYSGDLWIMCDERHLFNRSMSLLTQIPNIKGLIVWRKGHVGFYAGDGYVIESGSTRYGVTMTPIDKPQTGVKWEGYGYLRSYIQYDLTNAFNVVVVCAELNVRSSATSATRNNIVKTLKHNDVRSVSEVKGSWGKIPEGWINISKKYVKQV